ncbi:MAG: alpha-2-macroglobulin [Spirochaetales bacterium]|nr:alpha-2-macroglobulin [Spirochaetales bacterium]
MNDKINLSKITEWIKKHKLLFLGIAIAVVVFIGIFAIGGRQAAKPQPIEISFSVDEPFDTDYSENHIYPLTVYFRGSAAIIDDVGKTPSVLPEINPAIPGEWRWEDESTLSFSPSEPWGIGEDYSVKFSDDLFPEHVKVLKKTFDFSMSPFQISLSNSEFYIDPYDSSIKRILSEIHCNYPISKEELNEHITIHPDIKASSGKVENRDYSFETNISEDGKTVYIVSESVGMPAEEINMQITVKPGLVSAYGGKSIKDLKSASVTIPGLSTYVRINDIEHNMIKNDQMRYEQILTIDSKGRADIDEVADNLEIWLLPVDRPALPGLKARKDYSWGAPEEVVPEVLKLGKKLDFTAIPVSGRYNSVNSFKIDGPPDRYIYVKLKEGIKFYGGYYLGRDYKQIIQLKDYPREVSILSEGSVLSLSGSRKLSMLSRGIPEVDYRISRVRPDDLNHLVSQSNGNLSNFRFSNYRFDDENISEIYRESRQISNSTDPQELTYFSFDFNKYLNDVPKDHLSKGLFIFSVKGAHPYTWYSDKRFILVTDLGLLVKTSDNGSKDVFVQSLKDGSPVSSAVVELWGKNGNVIKSSSTGNGGHVSFSGLEKFENEHEPVAWVVRYEGDFSFMPYKEQDRRLDFSNFDIGGVHGVQDPKKLSAYLFSDRGIYRPGDRFNIGIIVKAGDWGIDLGGTPLEYTITDPSGLNINTRSIKLSSSGFEEINYTTQASSPTGKYTISLFVIEDSKRQKRTFLGSTQVKVEEFLPDTLTVNAGFAGASTDGWIYPDDVTAEISARNLFGTPAAGNKVKMSMTLSPGYRNYRQYPDYDFSDPLIADDSYSEDLGSLRTDANGMVSRKINLDKFAVGTYRLRINSEVFEKESGRSVNASASVVVSPLKFVVGRKVDGSAKYIKKGAERNISFIAINNNLEKIDAKNLKLRISEMKYVSSLVRQPNGVYKYKSIEKESPISEADFTISVGSTEMALPTSTPGDYTISVVAEDGTVLSETPFSIIGDSNIERSLDRNAELELKLDKTDYKPGESAEVFIKGPYSGGGLICVERDKVYNYKWFSLNGTSTTQYIEIPEELEGNGYISVTLLRGRASQEIYMSPLSYGTIPFSVSKDRRTNKITLDVPMEARPGEVFHIGYKTSSPGRIAVFAVDEGILQVAGYSTPDPISFFFKKRALEVSTSQILDLVLPEFDVVQKVSAMGGGMAGKMLASKLNPFKRKTDVPVAYWSGIVDSGPEQKELEYMIPDYFNGSLRVMAVVVSDDRLGAAEKTSLVRAPWVIQPNVPTQAAPGDEFDISVTVTNMNKGSGPDSKAVLTVLPDDHLDVVGSKTFHISMAEGKDSVVKMRLKALKEPGAAELTFAVRGLGETSKRTISLSVRPPVPYHTDLKVGVVEKGKAEINTDRDMYKAFAERTLSASYIPISLADGLNMYLEKFPYGCTEQITSMTFPKLYPQIIEGLDMKDFEVKRDVTRTIGILQARQNSDGGFGLWTSQSRTHPVIDSYVIHFLTLAREQGYYVPDSVFKAGLKHLEDIASENETSKNALINRCYAVYILTLNQIVTTSHIETLTKSLDSHFENWESGFAGMFLSGSYALMKQDRKASALIAKAAKSIKKENYMEYYNRLCFPSVYLYMLGEYFPDRIKSVSDELLSEMANLIGMGAYNTFSANYAMLGINSYLKAVPQSVKKGINVTEIDKEKNGTELKLNGERLMKTDYSAAASVLQIENHDSVPLFYQVCSSGYDSQIPEESNNGIEVIKEYVTDGGEVVDTIPVGDTINVRIRCRALTDSIIRNIAIVDLLPAGLEPDIRAIRESAKTSELRAEYTDIREDRLVLFTSVDKDIKEFTYKARAVNTGTFITPPAYAESMYDLGIWSINPCRNITITE